MSSKLHGPLQVLLWLVCAFHVVVGLGLNLSADFPQVMASYYGATVDWTPAFLYIVKPLGAFMLALGVMAGFAARDPLGHAAVVYGFVVLFAVRGLQRFIFQSEIGEAVGIEASRNVTNGIIFLVLAAALFFLFRAAGKGSGSSD